MGLSAEEMAFVDVKILCDPREGDGGPSFTGQTVPVEQTVAERLTRRRSGRRRSGQRMRNLSVRSWLSTRRRSNVTRGPALYGHNGTDVDGHPW